MAKAFRNMTKRERMVLVAEDVVARLRRDSLNITHLGYIWVDDYSRKEDTTDPKLVAERMLEECQVCAIGAIFLAGVVKEGSCPELATGMYSTTDIAGIWGWLIRHLEPAKNQLALIETAYEGRILPWHREAQRAKPKDIELAANYVTVCPSSRLRIYDIMQNIIRNKGLFKPSQLV